MGAGTQSEYIITIDSFQMQVLQEMFTLTHTQSLGKRLSTKLQKYRCKNWPKSTAAYKCALDDTN